MRIAYLILCHQNPQLLEKIVNRVTVGTDNIAVVHVDAKVEIEPFREPFADSERVFFIEDRYKVYWGGYNVARATLSCMEAALQHDCDRVVVYEGMTWPLHSNEQIDEYFTKHPETEFIRAINATKSNDRKHYMKCHGWYLSNVDVRSWNNAKSLFHHMLSIPRKLGIKYRRGYYVDPVSHRRMDVYWGWAFVSLTRKCAEYIIKTDKENASMRRYFSHVYIPGETYIASIVFNSKFRKKTMDGRALEDGADARGITYFEYSDEIRVFHDLEELKNVDKSQFLYVRKVACPLD